MHGKLVAENTSTAPIAGYSSIGYFYCTSKQTLIYETEIALLAYIWVVGPVRYPRSPKVIRLHSVSR